MSSKQEAKIYQSPIPSRLSDDLQWESLLRMIVSSLFFGVIHCIIYKADNGEILAQRRNNILTKYWRNMKILGNWKKLSGLHQWWKKIFYKCQKIFVVFCLLKQQCDAVGMVTSPSLQRFIAVWDFVHLAPTWKVINEILEFGSWWRAWRGRVSPALYISSRPTQSNVPRESKLAE